MRTFGIALVVIALAMIGGRCRFGCGNQAEAAIDMAEPERLATTIWTSAMNGTTADNQTPIMMTYYAAKNSGIVSPIDMKGEFTDLGVTGERNVGKSVPMRTTIQVLNNDRLIYELYFTPPGKPEMLVDRMVFDRIK